MITRSIAERLLFTSTLILLESYAAVQAVLLLKLLSISPFVKNMLSGFHFQILHQVLWLLHVTDQTEVQEHMRAEKRIQRQKRSKYFKCLFYPVHVPFLSDFGQYTEVPFKKLQNYFLLQISREGVSYTIHSLLLH